MVVHFRNWSTRVDVRVVDDITVQDLIDIIGKDKFSLGDDEFSEIVIRVDGNVVRDDELGHPLVDFSAQKSECVVTATVWCVGIP